MNDATLTEFEEGLKKMLNDDTPKPPYELWQQTKQGRVIGFYYCRPGLAFHEETTPGWYVVVESEYSCESRILHESNIRP